MRYLLLAVWIVLSASAASADWNEVMDALERASGGTKYDVGADPSQPEWVASRKARLEHERAVLRDADRDPSVTGDPIACRAPGTGDAIAHCE